MKTKTKIILTLSISILLFISYIIFDYINIFGKLVLNVERINKDFLSIFANNLIVVSLYLITYFLVDEKNAKARKNKKEILKYMIEDDYKTCLRYLEVLENKTQLNIIVEKLNDDGYLYKNEYFDKWMQVSFKNYNEIMQYSNQGIIDVNILKRYLYIKSNYSHTMSGYVLAAGMPKEVAKLIEEGHKNLIKTVKQELGKLDDYNCE